MIKIIIILLCCMLTAFLYNIVITQQAIQEHIFKLQLQIIDHEKTRILILRTLQQIEYSSKTRAQVEALEIRIQRLEK